MDEEEESQYDNDGARLSWDVLKMKIRRESIRYSFGTAKIRNKFKKNLQKEIKEVETCLAESTTPNQIDMDNFLALKKELEDFEKEKFNGAIL